MQSIFPFDHDSARSRTEPLGHEADPEASGLAERMPDPSLLLLPRCVLAPPCRALFRALFTSHTLFLGSAAKTAACEKGEGSLKACEPRAHALLLAPGHGWLKGRTWSFSPEWAGP